MNKYQIHKAALESNHEYAIELINQGVSLDELDESGHTPLHWAVFRGDIELVEILLKAGANPNVISDDGVTPRWRAMDFGLEEIEELLERFGGVIQDEIIDLESGRVRNLNDSLREKMAGQTNLYKEEFPARDTKRKWWKF